MPTDDTIRRHLMNRMEVRFERLYGHDAARECTARLRLLLSIYEDIGERNGNGNRWNQATNVLITYGDMVQNADDVPLQTLHRFLKDKLSDVIHTVHILPFCPYSSDDGFSVIDYRAVDTDLGAWDDVEAIGEDFELMFDLVLNHCSKRSSWFRNFVAGVDPAAGYFHDVDPEIDVSMVTRPRPWPLLTKVMTRAGERHVWTTFSEDQVDLNFANPDVMLEFLDILMFYVARGARIVRLDAIAYLWKQIGTTCIHLDETHEVVKVMRDLLQLVAPQVLLLTETNVPHEENISYFGDGDEAHVVYNFSLPPLLLHALQTGSARYVTRWAQSMDSPPRNCTFLNFTASHDGIGVRPLEGIIPTEERDKLVKTMRSLGGFVNEKTNEDGTSSPYELNITYFDAMGTPGAPDDETKVKRFLCSQTIAMSVKGIPAVYFHSLVAAPNDLEGVTKQGHNRAINRHKWNDDHLRSLLDDNASTNARVFDEYRRRLSVRSSQPAFHPDARQRVLSLLDEVFAVERLEAESGQSILCLFNLTGNDVVVSGSRVLLLIQAGCTDMLGNKIKLVDGSLKLSPYESLWLTS